MRILLLQDHEYAASGAVTGKVGIFVRHSWDGIIKLPAGMMADVDKNGCLVIGGCPTHYRPLDKPGAWVELITRDEMEAHVQTAEREARKCRAELKCVQDELFALQADIIRITSRITAKKINEGEGLAWKV